MNNLVILPIVIPFIAGALLIFFYNRIKIQRMISLISIIGSIAVSVVLVSQVLQSGIQTLEVGGWVPPFGIVLVADLLALIMVITANLVGLACLLYSFSSIGTGRERNYYYAFFQFLFVGVCGAFLTGDIFNLFVFFEVLLISSYILIIIGGDRHQFRETIKYVLMNIISSMLFVVGVAYLYAVTGTLNMAHLSVRFAEAGPSGMLMVLSMMFFFVFAMKGALFPLYFWLPGSYTVPPTAVAALFGGLLTKVGIYAIIRTFTLIFGIEQGFTQMFFLIVAGLTMVLGVLGALATKDVNKIIVYNIISAVGFMMMGIAFNSSVALAGTLWYVTHDMIIKACLILIGGTMAYVARTSHLNQMGGLIKYHPVLGWLFFAGAIALVGVPPLSGFVGKFLLIRGGLADAHYFIIGLSLVVSLLVLFSVMRIFMLGFWGDPKQSEEAGSIRSKGLIAPAALLIAISVIVGVGAEWFLPFFQLASEQLIDPSVYVNAVLKE
jgi:multicomponent Na+:H+ antiporter subunit D